MNSEKYKNFMTALKALCELHQVDLSIECRPKVSITDLESGEEYPFAIHDFKDQTKSSQ